MTQKDINNAVIKELHEICKQVWQRVKVEMPGTYTMKDLAVNEMKTTKLPIYQFSKNFENKTHTIEVGDFKCKVCNDRVFWVTNEYEKAVSHPTKERLVLSYSENEAEGELVFTLEKHHLDLWKCASDDEMRPAMASVCLDTKYSVLVATDGRVMAAMPVQYSVSKTLPQRYIPIPVPTFKKLKQGEVSVWFNEEFTHSEVCQNGCHYKGLQDGRYPKWNGVIPDIYDNCRIDVDPKQYLKTMKAVNKVWDKLDASHITLRVEGKKLIFKTRDNDYGLSASGRINIINEQSGSDIYVGVSGKVTEQLPKDIDGRIYISNASGPILFGLQHGGLAIQMPRFIDTWHAGHDEVQRIKFRKPDERTKAWLDIPMVQNWQDICPQSTYIFKLIALAAMDEADNKVLTNAA